MGIADTDPRVLSSLLSLAIETGIRIMLHYWYYGQTARGRAVFPEHVFPEAGCSTVSLYSFFRN